MLHKMPERNPNPKPSLSTPQLDARHHAILCQIFDNFELGVANVLPSGEILYANPKFALILGAPLHGNLLGGHLQDFIASRNRESLEIALRQTAERPVTAEIKVNAIAGRPQTIRFFMSQAQILNKPVVRIVTDEITELSETTSQLRETEESLRALSGRILQVHDQERRKLARDLHDTTGQELALLVMSLRRLADIGDQLGSDERKALLDDAADLARKVNDEIRSLAYLLHPPLLDELGLAAALNWYIEGFSKRSDIEVKLVVPDDSPRFPEDIENALFHVVQEGLTNILRHSGSRKAEIVVRASAQQVELTVKDEGKGLSALDLKRLAPSAGSKVMGVGIAGLRERLRQVSGTLDISSQHRGAILKATIPIAKLDARPSLSTPSPESRSEPPETPVAASDVANRKRILIVDDHDVIRRGVRALLENETDLEICGEAADGNEAVQKTAELHPDLIILDLNMPVFGGVYAANQLRHMATSAKILAFSMHFPTGMESLLRSAGCKGFVSKAHADRDLLRGIHIVLDGGEFFHSPAGQSQTA